MKRMAAIIAAAWMMLGLAWACQAAADGKPIAVVTVYTSHDDLNGRRDPWFGSDIIVTCKRGTTLSVYGANSEWAYIVTPEIGKYWVNVAYISSREPGDNGNYTVTGDGRVIVRDAPDGEPTGMYQYPGDTVSVICWIGDWANIGDGYLLGDYLERGGS